MKRLLKRFFEVKPTLPKFINCLSNKISKLLVLERSLGMPHKLSIEVTNFCNLTCKLCPTGNGSINRDKKMMVLEEFKKIIDKMQGHLLEINFSGFGEPFLNLDLYNMLEYVKNKGIFIRVYTNLIPVDEEGIRKIVEYNIDKLIVSLDAPDAEVYLGYKGVDGFGKALDNLRYIVEVKRKRCESKPFVELQFLMIKDNTAHIDKIKELARSISVDKLTLKTPNIYVGDYTDPAKLELKKWFLSEDFNRYKTIATSEILPCPWVWENLIIYANGDISPCCYDARGDYILGNIFLEDIHDIWNSRRYREFRRITFSGSDNKLCAVCMERRKGAVLAV